MYLLRAICVVGFEEKMWSVIIMSWVKMVQYLYTALLIGKSGLMLLAFLLLYSVMFNSTFLKFGKGTEQLRPNLVEMSSITHLHRLLIKALRFSLYSI